MKKAAKDGSIEFGFYTHRFRRFSPRQHQESEKIAEEAKKFEQEIEELLKIGNE